MNSQVNTLHPVHQTQNSHPDELGNPNVGMIWSRSAELSPQERDESEETSRTGHNPSEAAHDSHKYYGRVRNDCVALAFTVLCEHSDSNVAKIDRNVGHSHNGMYVDKCRGGCDYALALQRQKRG